MKSVKFLLSGLVIFLLLTGLNPALAGEIKGQKSQATSVFDLFKNIFQSFKGGFVSQPKIQDDSEAVKNYYQNFVEAMNRANFTAEEVAEMTKNDSGRFLALEELIEQAVQGKNLNDLRTSFSLWHQLDERVLSELNKLPTNNKVFSFHQTMIDWFGYHSKVAKRFSEENLSRDQINQLAQQFKKDAGAHMLKFRQSLEVSKESGKIFASFIPQARAVTCGALVPPPFYHFGGKMSTITSCLIPPGFVVIILPPCGGKLYFSAAMITANPFLWKIFLSMINTLGKSILTSGSCIIGFGPHHIPILDYYEATVIFFGTSLLPGL